MIDHQTGFNHSQDTWEYKPPLVSDIPLELNVELHNKAPVNERGINYIAGDIAASSSYRSTILSTACVHLHSSRTHPAH